MLMEGCEAMTRIEAAGIRIDVPYLDRSIRDVRVTIQEKEEAIQQDKTYQLWGKTYGNAMKLSSRTQLGHIVFDLMGHPRNKFMGKSNDSAAFEHLKLPFIVNYQEVERLKKALATNLLGIKRETVNGRLHPFFDLHTVESYRSSSSKPNLHNQPIRNKDISKIIRSSIIPSDGNVLLEPDLDTHEVRISYCHNEDPKLLYDIETGDMHTDRAKDLYMLSDTELGNVKQEPGKTIRYVAKNRFVFAEFYGDYYANIAPKLWDAIAIYDLRRPDGVSLFEHLKSKGIKELGACNPEEKAVKGTFEYHVQKIERKMWEKTYTVYNKWKQDWWALYQQQGGINYKTGFKLEGVFRRNQILCDPIQGSAFHCLLWVIIEAQKEFRRKKMKTKVVNQIHDSMLLDTPVSEIEDVGKIVKNLITKKLPQEWPWIKCQLAMGFDICRNNWYSKEPLIGVAI